MYKLTKSKEKYTITCYNTGKYYPLKIKKNNILLAKEEMINHLIRIKYLPEYNKLIAKILSFLEDDSNDDAGILLDELAHEREILFNLYEKYLTAEEKEYYLKNIRILANELRSRIYSKTKEAHFRR